VLGCAPDSVRHTKCRLLATDVSDTEGENVLREKPANISLDMFRCTLLAWPEKLRYSGFIPVSIMWHITQNAESEDFPIIQGVPYKAFL